MKAIQHFLLLIWLHQVIERAGSWNPQDSNHPCNIERLTFEEVYHRFGPRGVPRLYEKPLVLLHSTNRNELFRNLTRPDALIEFFPPNFQVTLSSSNSLSERRRTISLTQYLNESITSQETPVNQLSNESWYLFGETYTDDWKRLLENYELPPCVVCSKDMVALSFGIGNRGSGVQWHIHGPGFSEAVHGRKHWLLYDRHHLPEFHKDESSRQWMEYKYPTARPRPYECTLDPGDLIYFPDKFWHATLNLDPYTSFVSTFTRDHDFKMLDEL